MNNKDLDVFNEWRNSTSTRLDIHDAWQAACEYKQQEIDELISILDLKKETNIELEAENKKLREALEYIYETQCAGCNLEEIMTVCREALKEVENK